MPLIRLFWQAITSYVRSHSFWGAVQKRRWQFEARKSLGRQRGQHRRGSISLFHTQKLFRAIGIRIFNRLPISKPGFQGYCSIPEFCPPNPFATRSFRPIRHSGPAEPKCHWAFSSQKPSSSLKRRFRSKNRFSTQTRADPRIYQYLYCNLPCSARNNSKSAISKKQSKQRHRIFFPSSGQRRRDASPHDQPLPIGPLPYPFGFTIPRLLSPSPISHLPPLLHAHTNDSHLPTLTDLPAHQSLPLAIHLSSNKTKPNTQHARNGPRRHHRRRRHRHHPPPRRRHDLRQHPPAQKAQVHDGIELLLVRRHHSLQQQREEACVTRTAAAADFDDAAAGYGGGFSRVVTMGVGDRQEAEAGREGVSYLLERIDAFSFARFLGLNEARSLPMVKLQAVTMAPYPLDTTSSSTLPPAPSLHACSTFQMQPP